LKAATENKIERFIYAASSSTYGDSKELPKVENNIGNPLSPYAVSKYVNELYANVFSQVYNIDVIGLRYFNVYGKKQNINGPYAAVIPKFINLLMNNTQPIINGDGSYSRDFTHIENVIQMNLLALTTSKKESLNQVYNTAVGDRTTILELFNKIKENLLFYDKSYSEINPKFGSVREGDVPHSKASIEKAKALLDYNPKLKISSGLKLTVDWFYNYLTTNK
jgi:UDP-N-acetylglucosamine 4-epimerase